MIKDIQLGIKSDSVSEIAASESESAVLVTRPDSERDDDTVSNVTEEATDWKQASKNISVDFSLFYYFKFQILFYCIHYYNF